MIERDRMVAFSIGKTYVKVCQPGQESKPVVVVPTANEILPIARYQSIQGSTENPGSVIGTFLSENQCLEIGNNTPPSGWFSNLMDFLGSVAPFVAAAYGIPAL